jgi:hypothetical protein
MLFALGFLTGIAVQDGEISSVDAARRLQVTHSLWTSEPPVKDGDYPGFGVVGRDGEIHAWYGIGQSLVMLPADVVGSLLVGQTTPDAATLAGRIKQAFVAYATFPLLTAGCVLLGYSVLLQLGLGLKASALGAMGMLFGTTLLQWTQIEQENSLTLLCFLCTLYACLRWLSTGRCAWIAIAGCAAGFVLLVRVTTVLETAAVGGFVLMMLFLPKIAGSSPNPIARRQWLLAGGIFAAVFSVFVFADRSYQWLRFGSWTNTYIGVHQQQNPSFYAGGDWWQGLWRLLFSPMDSVFWMEPGLWLFALLLLFSFQKVPQSVRYLGICCLLALGVLVAFYAPYPFCAGGSSWGSRYTTTPVIVLGLLGFGLAAQLWKQLPGRLRLPSAIIVALAVMWQVGSVLHWYVLEEIQFEDWGREYFLVGQRWMNSLTLLFSDFSSSSLMTPRLSDRLLRFNFTPFHVRAELGEGLGTVALLAWALLLAVLLALVIAIWRTASKHETSGGLTDAP